MGILVSWNEHKWEPPLCHIHGTYSSAMILSAQTVVLKGNKMGVSLQLPQNNLKLRHWIELITWTELTQCLNSFIPISMQFYVWLTCQGHLCYVCRTHTKATVATRFRECVCGRSLAWVVGSNPAEACMSVSCEYCFLWGRGFSDWLITRPEESYVWVWSRNLNDEEA
jgi:hypothetical protein